MLCLYFRLLDRGDKDRKICIKYLIRMCVQRYLKQREEDMRDFESNFHQLMMPDEKTELLYSFLEGVVAEMERDPLWTNIVKDESTIRLNLKTTNSHLSHCSVIREQTGNC
jgi:hypothetical protein